MAKKKYTDFFEVSPAYGRRYGSEEATQAGWDANHDFYSHTHGTYLNKSDHARYMPDAQIIVRSGGTTTGNAQNLYNIKHGK
jgi:hypothetical protein